MSGTALATIDGVEITLLEDHFDGLQQVVDGRIDAYFADRAILNGLIRLQGTEAVVTSNKTYTVEPYALAIPRGDDAFRLVIDRALSSLYRSGAIYEIFQRYFGQPPSDVVFFFTATALPE